MSLLDMIKQKSICKDVFFIAGGTVIAHGFTMAIMPVISRLYSPSDFGVASLFVAIMSILAPFSSLRYFLAIALPKSQKHAESLVILSFIIQIIYFAFVFCVFIFIGEIILNCLDMHPLVDYKLLIPFGVLGASAYETLVQCAIRAKLFSLIGRTKISQSISGGLVKIGIGAFAPSPLGLIIGTIIGQAGGITSIMLALGKIRFFKSKRLYQLKRVAIKYRNFPFYEVPLTVLNNAGIQIISILMFSFYGAADAGLFSMANQLLAIPSAIVGSAIGQVFLQRASVARYNGNLDRLTWETYKALIISCIVPMLFFAIFSPMIFKFIFGARWTEAGIYARYLVPVSLVSFAYSPISHIYNILNKQKLAFLLEIIYFFSRISSFYLGTFWGGPHIALAFYSLGGTLGVLLRTFYAIRSVNVVAK